MPGIAFGTPMMIARTKREFHAKNCEGDEAEIERNRTRIIWPGKKSQALLLQHCDQSFGVIWRHKP